MKKFTKVLLSVIFIALVTGSIQSTSADDSLDDQGIWKDEKHVSFSSTKDSKYLIHLQVVVKDAQGQLISVSEALHGKYLAHEMTDYVFDKMLGKKEIVIIDNMKYQKAHHTQIKNAQHLVLEGVRFEEMQSAWAIEYCKKTDEQEESCMQVFSTITAHVSLEEDDTFTIHWTILRKLN